MNDNFIEFFLKITSKVINSRNKLQNFKKESSQAKSFICELSVKYDEMTTLDCMMQFASNIRVSVMRLSKQTKISYFCTATRLEIN